MHAFAFGTTRRAGSSRCPPPLRNARSRSWIRVTPSDTLDPSLVAFELLRAEDKPGEGTAIREPYISGALVAFELPAATTGQAWSGPARLRFLGTQGVEPMHPACPVDTCSVDLAFEVPTLPLTLED